MYPRADGSMPGLRGYDPKDWSERTAIVTGGVSIVQQHLKDEVDINTIVRRFGITREMPSGIDGGVYGDFSGIADYEDAVAAIKRANDGFMALPPEVRERFENDPGKLIEFVHEATEEQLREFDPVPVVPASVAPAAPVVAPVAPVVAPVAPGGTT